MKNHNFLRRLGYALAGIKTSWRTERTFRTLSLGMAFILAVLVATRPAPIWWAALLLTAGSVVALELINTAVEKLIDHVHPDQHEIVGIVKDTLAGAVLTMSVTSLLVFAAFFVSLIS
ncbi:MAG TPA: diacylglycerol kinase [Alphaproteobacteria bacterium]|jgi:diacylglycerol kinase (ATP)|nr:diacylglycerol kinase [Alphaproteobacteria bacterium]